MTKNVLFTRDEAILALDTLLFSGEEHLNANSTAIKELSNLLNSLPIIPQAMRGEVFRNCTGVSKQISMFRLSSAKGEKNPNVGAIFYSVADDYRGNEEEIHRIATAIKRNFDYFDGAVFGAVEESGDFPEGALLGHLHRMIEIRDSKKLKAADVCDVCHLDLSQVYKPVPGGFMQLHLMLPVTELDSCKKYKPDEYVTVCPNCHAVLHKHRPWVTRETLGGILY